MLIRLVTSPTTVHDQCLAFICAIYFSLLSQTKTKKNHKYSLELLSPLQQQTASLISFSLAQKVGIFWIFFFRRKKYYYINFSRLKLHWKISWGKLWANGQSCFHLNTFPIVFLFCLPSEKFLAKAQESQKERFQAEENSSEEENFYSPNTHSWDWTTRTKT